MFMQLVVFKLDGEEYGIDISKINSILFSKKFSITKIPTENKAIEGIINLRGKINYIFNLRVRFDLPKREIGEESKFIMLSLENSSIGFLVDEVTDIIKVEDSQIEAQPTFVSSKDSCIDGIAKIDERIIVLLNIYNVLSSSEDLLEVSV